MLIRSIVVRPVRIREFQDPSTNTYWTYEYEVRSERLKNFSAKPSRYAGNLSAAALKEGYAIGAGQGRDAELSPQ